MTDYLKLGSPMPASIGRCADLYSDVRTLRLSMAKEVEAMQARESEIKTYIIDNLSKSIDTGAAGLRYRAQIVTKRKFNISDWGILTSWIKKNDRFDMIQHRLSDTAAKDFEEVEGRTVPGTEAVNVPDVSITKI